MFNNILFRWRKAIVLSAAFLFLTAVGTVLSGCKKKDNLLGGKAYNQDDLLSSGGMDTFSLVTYTIADDSVFTTNPSAGLLGIVNDREFGVVDVGFYTQVRLSGLNPNFGNVPGITIDSFILAMEYSGGYGYLGDQTFEVYELDERMYKDTLYRSDRDLAVKPENLVHGSGTINVNPKGITVVGNDTVTTQMRIPLKHSKALQIIQDASNYPAEFANNDLFSSNYFKGIHVKTNGVAPPEGQGMVAYFNLLDADSRMIIYYKEDGVVKPPFHLVFNNDCVDFNRYSYNNAGKKIDALITDSTLGQNEFYAQAGKYRGVIGFPTLKHLPKNIVIHSAKLHLPVQNLAGSKFTLPSQLGLLLKGVKSTEVVAAYDPYLKGYVADLQVYVQAYSLGTISYEEMTISPKSFISSADRVIFNGQESDKKMKPRLIISYTEF